MLSAILIILLSVCFSSDIKIEATKSDTLPKNIKRIINKKGFAYTEILNRWSYLVGSKISQVSFPKAAER